jgi:hypothetical protein
MWTVTPNTSRAALGQLNPADKTLQWEKMFGKMVLRYAKDRGYLGDNTPIMGIVFQRQIRFLGSDVPKRRDDGRHTKRIVQFIGGAKSTCAPCLQACRLIKTLVSRTSPSGKSIRELDTSMLAAGPRNLRRRYWRRTRKSRSSTSKNPSGTMRTLGKPLALSTLRVRDWDAYWLFGLSYRPRPT